MVLFIYFNLTLILLALIPEQTSGLHTVCDLHEQWQPESNPRGKTTHKVLNYPQQKLPLILLPLLLCIHSRTEKSLLQVLWWVDLHHIINDNNAGYCLCLCNRSLLRLMELMWYEIHGNLWTWTFLKTYCVWKCLWNLYSVSTLHIESHNLLGDLPFIGVQENQQTKSPFTICLRGSFM